MLRIMQVFTWFRELGKLTITIMFTHVPMVYSFVSLYALIVMND